MNDRLDDDWADEAIDEHAREGEHLDDRQLSVKRIEARFSDALWAHFDDTVNLLGGDAREFLRDELFEDDEIEELQRRIVWLETRAAR